MKVALIDPSLFTLPYDQELAAALAARGHDVTIYGTTPAAGEKRRDDVHLEQFFYRALAPLQSGGWPRGVVRIAKGISHIADMRRLVRHLAGIRPDIIHFQWLPLPVADRRFLPALRRIAPVVLTQHDTQPFNANPGSAVQSIGALTIAAGVDHVILHTERGRARMIEHGLQPHRLTRIAHGFGHDDAAIPPPLPASADRPVELLLFGKVKPYKGTDMLIEAVARMRPETRAKLRVTVAGKPYMDVQPLLALAEARGVTRNFVFQFGFVPDGEIAQIFARSDVSVFPYREIEVSGVLQTALHAGRPIVASAIGGFAELLEDGTHGYLVPPEDPAALAAALDRIVADPARRTAMQKSVATLAATMPGWHSVARSTEELYQRLHDALPAVRRAA